MREVSPEVYVLASTFLDEQGVDDYLTAIGADDWDFAHPPILRRSDADMLIELAGRSCYMSFGTELNNNITRVREDPVEYLTNILRSRHGSVLEHASVTFAFHNVSRVLTHELVRHRVGTGISQESGRYVRTDVIRAWIPPELEPVRREVIEILETLEDFEREIGEKLDVDGMGFEQKKRVTSAMRRVLPNGAATTIIWTANFRTLRHVIEVRTSRHAEREIRLVFARVAEIMQERYPLLFGDFVAEEVDGINEYTTPYSKV